MSDKSRNFRSSYYDKVGFRGVEEKKSLEILINEKPMDKEKLSKFCLRFTLPAMYREYVWEVLLGVLPVNSENHSSISRQRSEHYEELRSGLEFLFRLTTAPTPLIHALMFLVTEDIIEFDIHKQLSTVKVQNLMVLASLFLEVSTTEVVAYWTFRNFVLQQRKLHRHPPPVTLGREILESILRKEDESLWGHLCAIKCFDVLPLELWFERVFAETLHESSLARICDKVIGGSFKILPYILAALLIVRRHLLLPLQDANKVVEILQKNPEDVSELAVNKALELYYTASH